MRLSISSVFITLITASLLILFLHVLLTGKKSHAFFRTDFLTVLLLTILLRLLFPIEFPFTITILSRHVMTAIRNVLIHPFARSFTLLQLLLVIWGMGVLLQGIRLLWRIRSVHALCTYLKKQSRELHLSDFGISCEKADHPVYICNEIQLPMVPGFQQAIFLPADTCRNEDLHFILLHEAEHIRHHDIFIKQLVNILAVIYWWFPPIYLLQKQIDLYLDMRVDTVVTRSMTLTQYQAYMQTILDIQKRQVTSTPESMQPQFNCFLSHSEKSLTFRIHYLMEGIFKKRTNRMLLLFAFILPFLSNAIIMEPDYINSPAVQDTFSEDDFNDGYIIHHKDGTYTFVIAGNEVHINDPDGPDFQGIPIIEED